jgi:hypothetical protein
MTPATIRTGLPPRRFMVLFEIKHPAVFENAGVERTAFGSAQIPPRRRQRYPHRPTSRAVSTSALPC